MQNKKQYFSNLTFLTIALVQTFRLRFPIVNFHESSKLEKREEIRQRFIFFQPFCTKKCISKIHLRQDPVTEFFFSFLPKIYFKVFVKLTRQKLGRTNWK